MTEPTGTDLGAPTGTPSEPEPQGDASLMDFGSLLSQSYGVRDDDPAPAPEPPEPAPGDVDPTEGDDSNAGTGDDGAQDSPDDSATTDANADDAGDVPASERSVDEWEALLRRQPQRIHEVPGRMRGELLARAYRAAQEAEQRGREAGQREAIQGQDVLQRKRAAVAEIDELRQSDPAAYVEWQENFPERDETYRAVKAELAQLQQPTPPQQDMTQDIIRRAADVINTVASHPEILAKLEKENFPATLDGLLALKAAAAVELNKLDTAPIRDVQQAAAAHRARPRTGAPSATPPAASGPADTNDIGALLTAAFRSS